MNRALATVLRRAIEHIREAATNSDMSEGALQMEAARSAVLDAVWRILVIYLGTPPISFTWQHRDKYVHTIVVPEWDMIWSCVVAGWEDWPHDDPDPHHSWFRHAPRW